VPNSRARAINRGAVVGAEVSNIYADGHINRSVLEGPAAPVRRAQPTNAANRVSPGRMSGQFEQGSLRNYVSVPSDTAVSASGGMLALDGAKSVS
jgi:hypothetical protein